MRDGDKPASQIVKDLDQIVIWIKIVKDLDSVQKQQDELLARMGAALDWLSKKIGRPGASDFSDTSCERDSAIGLLQQKHHLRAPNPRSRSASEIGPAGRGLCAGSRE